MLLVVQEARIGNVLEALKYLHTLADISFPTLTPLSPVELIVQIIAHIAKTTLNLEGYRKKLSNLQYPQFLPANNNMKDGYHSMVFVCTGHLNRHIVTTSTNR
ncbi:hypothetical protein MMC20_001875 [Loxospora ochrophaea]|nr:hypothetical protein [Loxospora ochrophaea]